MAGIINALELIVSAQTGSAITGLRAVGREVDSLDRQLGKVGRGNTGLAGAAAAIETEQRKIAQARQKAVQVEEQYNRALTKANATYGQQARVDAERAALAQLRVDDARDRLGRAKTPLRIAAAESSLEKAEGAQRIAELNVAKRTISEIAAAEKSAIGARTSVAGFRDDETAAVLRLTEAQRLLSESYQGTSRAAAAAGIAGKASILTLGVYLAGASAAALSFDERMRNVNSIQLEAGESAADSGRRFKEQGDAILALSQTVPQSANNLAEGLYEIASSGFRGAEGLHVLDVAARAATAGVTSTDTAAKAIVSVLNAYGLEAAQAGDVSDALFQTVKDGVLRFDELATALNYSVNAASSAGITFGEMGASLATLTRNGVQGARSGVIFANVVAKIITPSKELLALFQAQGFASGAAALEALGFAGVLELVRNATGGAADGIARLFHEQRAFRGVAALTANGGKTLAEEMDRIGTASGRAGATQATFQEQMKATTNRIKLAFNDIRADAIKLGQAFLPSLALIAEAVKALTGFLVDNKEIVATLAALYVGSLARGAATAALQFVGLTTNATAATAALTAQASAARAANAANALATGIPSFPGLAGPGLLGRVAAAPLVTSVSGLLPAAALVAGLYQVTKGYQEARASASSAITRIREGRDLSTTSGLLELAAAAREAANGFDEVDRSSSALDFLNPFNLVKTSKVATEAVFGGKAEALKKEAERAEKAAQEMQDQTRDIAKALNFRAEEGSVEFTNFERNIAAAAKSLDIDLKNFLDPEDADKLKQALAEVEAQSGGAIGGVLGVADAFEDGKTAAEEFRAAVAEAGDEAREAFTTGFEIVGKFALPDIGEVKEKIAELDEEIAQQRRNIAEKATAQRSADAKKGFQKELEDIRKRRSALKKEEDDSRQAPHAIAQVQTLADKTGLTPFEVAVKLGLSQDKAYDLGAEAQNAKLKKQSADREALLDAEEAKVQARLDAIDAKSTSQIAHEQRDRDTLAETQKARAEEAKKLAPGFAAAEYEKSLKKQATDASRYYELIGKAQERGLNPDRLIQLATKGPEGALPALEALVGRSGDAMIKVQNGYDANQKLLTEKFVANVRLQKAAQLDPTKAPDVGLAKRISDAVIDNPAASLAAIARTAKTSIEEVRRVQKEFGLLIAAPGDPIDVAKNFGAEAGAGLAKVRDVALEILGVMERAAGIKFDNLRGAITGVLPSSRGNQAQQYDPNAPGYTDPTRITLPASPSAGARMMVVPSQYIAPPPSVPVRNQGASTNISAGPTTVSNTTNFNGPVQGTTPEQAAKWAAQKKRQSNLTGSTYRRP